MTHLDDGTIQALLHGELESGARQGAAAHAALCAACQAAVERAREEDRWTLGKLALLDVAPPRVDIAGVRRAARHQASTHQWRRAATILVVAGGASLAWALAPVREFARSLFTPSADSTPATVPEVPVKSAETDEPSSGIAVVPTSRFVIDLEAAQAAGMLRIRLSDRVDVSIVTRGARVALESREGSVLVRNQGSAANYEVEVPRGAADVEVRASGRRLWSKRGAAIETTGALGRDAWYVIELRGR